MRTGRFLAQLSKLPVSVPAPLFLLTELPFEGTATPNGNSFLLPKAITF
jgi:hypothetical protein